ncbi:MAG: alpha/beta hydrolase [Gammaproteobacteria bacterium]|nr:alpha/beta hydrolase [Gammaproteobacteria bacterium]
MVTQDTFSALLSRARMHLPTSVHIVVAAISIYATTALADEWRPEVKTLRVNNYDMSYVERGSSAPLVLIHGSLSDYRTWLPLLAELSETNRAIAVSLRHYYPEQWDGKGDDLSLQQHADDMAGFIQALQSGPVDLLGHSRGAAVALLVASQHPALVRKLVLADPAPLNAMLSNNVNAQNDLQVRKTRLQEVMRHYQQGDSDGGLEVFVNYIAGNSAWENTSEARRDTLRANSWTQVSQLQDYETPFDCGNARKITAPVLLITGERSAPLYGYMHSALKPCLKQVDYAIIADAGHMMFSASPTAFVFEVQEFIAP